MSFDVQTYLRRKPTVIKYVSSAKLRQTTKLWKSSFYHLFDSLYFFHRKWDSFNTDLFYYLLLKNIFLEPEFSLMQTNKCW